MARSSLPPPSIVLEPAHARQFLLLHQRLLPPRRLAGKTGVVELFEHLGCVQYDPIDIVGRNPDLVLQARVRRYRPTLLDRLMHKEHRLYVGWDKMSAIVLRETWPAFARHRALMVKQHGNPESPAMKLAPYILEEIRRRGPLSSTDIEHAEKVDWWWGRQTRLVHASLEILSAMGTVMPHHRVRSVRYFDLTERVLPAEILNAPDPHPDDASYEDWHVLRRIGSLGLAPSNGAAEYWWGIMGVRGGEARSRVLARLAERGDAVPIGV
ncbi:MAG: crosslink repair DNA glycosylase YcaQ family protein, partial [Candidatus Bipolaricaulia bacterium]